MAQKIVPPEPSTQATRQTQSREEQSSQLLHELHVGVADIRDILQFVIDSGPIGNADFPRGVAASIGMTHARAATLCKALEDFL